MFELIQKIQPRIVRLLSVNAILCQVVRYAQLVQLLLELPDFIAVSADIPRKLIGNSG